jgi:hypothetical protein
MIPILSPTKEKKEAESDCFDEFGEFYFSPNQKHSKLES